MDWTLIIFTWMLHIPAAKTILAVDSEQVCHEKIEKFTPIFESIEGLRFTLECEALKDK